MRCALHQEPTARQKSERAAEDLRNGTGAVAQRGPGRSGGPSRARLEAQTATLAGRLAAALRWVASSGLHTPGTRRLVSIRNVFGNRSIPQAAVHRLASDQHCCRGILVKAGTARFRGDPQIYLSGDKGDNHNCRADAEGSDCNLEVLRHG